MQQKQIYTKGYTQGQGQGQKYGYGQKYGFGSNDTVFGKTRK